MFSACKFWWNLCNDEMREGELQLIGLQLHPCMYFFQEGVGLASALSLELCSGMYSYSVPLSILSLMWLEEVPGRAPWRAIFTEGLMDLEGTGVSIQEAMSIVFMVLYTKIEQKAPEVATILASLSGYDQELPVIVYHVSVQ